MNLVYNKTKVILVVILCLIFSFIPFNYVNSEEFPGEATTGLDFSELFNIVELQKGETYKHYFSVTNVTDSPITFTTEIMPYTQVDNEGGISLKISTSETAITDWTQLFWDKEVTLNPGEEVKINYVIDVPEDCSLGDQKEVIMINALTPNKYGVRQSNGYIISATIVNPLAPFPITAIIGIIIIIFIIIGLIIFIIVKKKQKKHKKR